MKTTLSILAVLALSLFFLSACDKDKPDDLTTFEAFNNYWTYQADLNASLDARAETMDDIVDALNSLASKGGKDGLDDIKNLVQTYQAQSEAAADGFDKLIQAENAFKPYGDSKGIFDFGKTCAKGVYSFAKNAVVSGCQQVNTVYSVAVGEQSVSEALYNPDSGIPFISTINQKLQAVTTAQDNAIRQAILENDSHNGDFPLDQIPGTTPQQKLNIYNSWPDSHPLKKECRGSTLIWDPNSGQTVANAAKDLGETGVKTFADATGAGVVNEIVEQHMEAGQPNSEQGTLKVTLNEEGGAHPPITAPKTIIISKANKPADDARVTVLTNAPQALEQPLPTGIYNVIVMAEGFIRNVYQNLQIVQGQMNTVASQLAKLAENPIIIENLSVENGCLTVGVPLTANVTCVSTLGKELSFDWTVTGGTYDSFSAQGASLTFKPKQEKEYTISVTVSDTDGNSKTRSLAVTTQGGKLEIDDWTVSGESFVDGKVNPGETAVITLYVSNTGETSISGTQSVTGSEGIGVDFPPAAVTIAGGQTLAVPVSVSLASEQPFETGSLQYSLLTQNANNIPAQITDIQEFPISFYVAIDDIDDTVTERVVNITGKVANPQLTTAVLFLDNDLAHGYDLNLSSGSFSQNIVLPGSDEEESHSVRVIAVAGALAADDVMSFDVDIPLMALRATLTWDTNGTDVDFWITDPNGEKCYYAHSTTASGLMLDVDDVNGYGPENITTAETIPGDYLVQVHYYSDHDYENAIGSNCQVTIVRDEDPAQTSNYYGFVGDTGDIWTVVTLTYDAAKGWKVKPVNTRGKVDPATLPAK